MARVKFNARNVRTLKAPGEGFAEYFDKSAPGFGLRVSSEGRRTWFIRYRVRGRRAKSQLSLGTLGNVSLADARRDARAYLATAAKGSDPAEPIRLERRADTFKELAGKYIAEYAKPKKRSWRGDQWIIDAELVPVLGNMRAMSIKRGDIRDILDEIAERGAPIQANRTLALVRKIFNWALDQEIGGVEVNPASGIKRPAKERQRDRVLTPDEVSTLWRRLRGADTDISEAMRLALKFQLVTAQRKGEVLAAEWSEMDLREKVWTIPGPKSKNGLPHRVPLSSLAVSLLREIKKAAIRATKALADGKAPPPPRWLFPSPRGEGPITGAAVNHAVRAALPKLGLNNFTPHDLRRSAASYMTGARVSRLVVGKVLNHVESGITRVYDRHGYDAEKRAALDTWSDRLRAMIARQASAERRA